MILIQYALTWSLERTWLGGKNFMVSGMENPFSFFPPLSLCLTFPSVLMHLVLLVMVLLWTTNGLNNGRWSTLQLPLSIAYKKLFLVVLAPHVWGPGWSRRRIMFHVDNEADVHILNSRTCPDPKIMHLLHSSLKVAACFSLTFAAIHVPGRNNGIADTLSRFNFQAFHSLAPQAKEFPILIPLQLLAKLSLVI